MKKKVLIFIAMLTLSLITLLGVNKVSANSRTSMYGDNIINVPVATGVFTTNNNLCIVNGYLSSTLDYFSQSNFNLKGGYLIFDISSSNYGTYSNKLGVTIKDNGASRSYSFNSSNGGYLVTGITDVTFINLWISAGNYSNFIWDVNIYHTKTLNPIEDSYNKGYDNANKINSIKDTLGVLYDSVYQGYVDYDSTTLSSTGLFNSNNQYDVPIQGTSIDLNYLATYVSNDILSPSISSTSTNSITINIYFSKPIKAQLFNMDISGINDISFLNADGICYSISSLDIRSTTTINVPINDNLYGMVLEIDNYSLFYKTSHLMTIVNANSFDYEIGYNKGYENGYKESQNNIDDKLKNEYDKGYDVGYENGYQQGIVDENPITLTSLMYSIGQIPINMISSIFNFEVFGVNLFTALCSVLTLLLVVWAIRKFL